MDDFEWFSLQSFSLFLPKSKFYTKMYNTIAMHWILSGVNLLSILLNCFFICP